MTFKSPQQMVDTTEPAILVKSNSTSAITVKTLHMTNNTGEGRLSRTGSGI